MPTYMVNGYDMNITEEEYAKIQENNKKEQRVMDSFQSYFETDKIKNPNLRHTYTSPKCELTVTGKVTIAYGSPDDPQGWLNDYFNNCNEGYDDILRDLNLANDFIVVMREQGADTEEKLLLSEEGIEDIRNEVMAKTKLLQTLRKYILNE